MSATSTNCLSPAELHRLIEAGTCQLIDVREPVEFAEERIPSATLVPLAQLEQRAGQIDRSRSVIVMCRSGKRGGQAMAKLQTLGYTDVRNLDGGILAWKAAGQPVECPPRKVLPLMRQVQLVIGLCVVTGSVLALTVNPLFALIPAFFGTGLTMAGASGWCGLALLLAKMPWNNAAVKCETQSICR